MLGTGQKRGPTKDILGLSEDALAHVDQALDAVGQILNTGEQT
jgi:hypothetical protein